MLQQAKEHVWSYWNALGDANQDGVAKVLADYVAEDVICRTSRPIPDHTGRAAHHAQVWQPLKNAVSNISRETFMFFADTEAKNDEGVWVAGAGYLIGRFAQDWYGIPANGQNVRIRFCEMNWVKNGYINQTFLLLDVVDWLLQCGHAILPPSNGDPNLFPPPMTQEGILLSDQDASESRKSHDLVYAMLFDGLMSFDEEDLQSMGMTKYWSQDMHWYGPQGIGGCRNLTEFEDFHQRPFLQAFPDRYAPKETVLVSEGSYTAALGFPGVVATHTSTYLGLPPTNVEVKMNLMDFWRREGDVLVENWVWLDLIDMWQQFGVDLLAQFKE